MPHSSPLQTLGLGLALGLTFVLTSSLLAAPGAPSPPPPPASQSAATQPATRPAPRSADEAWRDTDRKLDAVVSPIDLHDVPASKAFVWWAKTTGVDLNINRSAMLNDGVDPDQPITLVAERMSARTLLGKLMDLASPNQRLVYERNPWFIEVMTKAHANRNPVVRMYDVAELLPPVREMVHVTAVGPNGSASGTFTPMGPGERAPIGERGADEISRLIRAFVEPDVWAGQGGDATIQYFRGQLIVRAPLYVQMQIGKPVAALRETTR
ncbi:MAG: hypothetical protein NTW19_08550 [Planctomycetota bacterium]|nr:hypothetical protein [Planctomycetota bacterium]